MPPSNSVRPFVCFACRCRPTIRSSKRIKINTSTPRIRNLSLTRPLYATSAQEPGYYPPPDGTSKTSFARLKNRALIRLHGADVVHFLNGLLPAKLQPPPKSASTPIFTAFLSAKGRILFDAFVFPPTDQNADEGSWYIDVDARSASTAFSHLKKHKLRSKFKLEKISPEELEVYYMWPSSRDGQTVGLPSPDIGGQDPRPLMGTRFLASSSILSTLKDSGTELSQEDYKIHRMLTGHAEGPSELIANSALPQESNLDFLDGIDFHKGCYLGQELTIRTHHTGVVRKRILPCQIYTTNASGSQSHVSNDDTPAVPIYDSSLSDTVPSQPPPETNLYKVRSPASPAGTSTESSDASESRGGGGSRTGRSTGKYLSGTGNIGLALCRLEMMTDLQITNNATEGTSSSNNNSGDQFKIVWEEIIDDHSGDGAAAGGAGLNEEKTTMVREVRIKPFVPSWLRSCIENGIRTRKDKEENKKRRAREEQADEDVD